MPWGPGPRCVCPAGILRRVAGILRRGPGPIRCPPRCPGSPVGPLPAARGAWGPGVPGSPVPRCAAARAGPGSGVRCRYTPAGVPCGARGPRCPRSPHTRRPAPPGFRPGIHRPGFTILTYTPIQPKPSGGPYRLANRRRGRPEAIATRVEAIATSWGPCVWGMRCPGDVCRLPRQIPGARAGAAWNCRGLGVWHT